MGRYSRLSWNSQVRSWWRDKVRHLQRVVLLLRMTPEEREKDLIDRLKVFDEINKKRPLLPHEEERMLQLSTRLQQHRYQQTEAGKATRRKAAKTQREKNPDKVRKNRRKWYANSPEASQKAVQRVRDWRNKKRAEKGQAIEDLD